MKKSALMKKVSLLEAIETNKLSVVFPTEKAMANVKEILSQPLLPAEQEKIYTSLNDFVALNFVYNLSQKYPIISEEIFDLKRESKMEITERYGNYTYLVELPVIVRLPLEKSNQGKLELTVTGKKEKDQQEKSEIKVSCNIPEITPEARIALAEAVKYSAELTSRAYQDGLISRILVRDRMREKEINGPLYAQYNLVWAPSEWNAELVERDPAIFMSYWGRNLLVYHWNVPEERSLDGILREFKENLDFTK